MSIVEVRLPLLVDGVRLSGGAYIPEGAVALVVLLHGIPSVDPPEPGDTGYPGLARTLASMGFAAVWADMRGAHGSAGYFSIEGWVRDCRAVIDAARSLDGAEGLRLGVVGSSAGGAVAAEAARRGAPVDALVLLAAPARWLSFAGDAAEGVRRISDEAGMPLHPDVLADPTDWGAEFERVTTADSLPHVRCPVMIVHGTDDDVVPVEHARQNADRAQGARLRIIEGAPHKLRLHDGVVDMVVAWLRSELG